MTAMAAPPPSTKINLSQRLAAHARTHWPQLSRVAVRFRGPFAYIDGHLHDGERLALCRLRYGGSASQWGFAIYRASHNDYENNFLPSGHTAGNPEEALDCACHLYIGGPSTHHRRTNDDAH